MFSLGTITTIPFWLNIKKNKKLTSLMGLCLLLLLLSRLLFLAFFFFFDLGTSSTSDKASSRSSSPVWETRFNHGASAVKINACRGVRRKRRERALARFDHARACTCTHATKANATTAQVKTCRFRPQNLSLLRIKETREVKARLLSKSSPNYQHLLDKLAN